MLHSQLLLILAAACIYSRRWHSPPSAGPRDDAPAGDRTTLSKEDDAKLIFGVVFSLRNISRRLGGDDNR
jgi:hypothetical protein